MKTSTFLEVATRASLQVAVGLAASPASELASTTVAGSGSDTTLNTRGDYVRIDGPRCWMEFVCQNGVVFSSQIHFHSVWRDKASDYGSDFTF